MKCTETPLEKTVHSTAEESERGKVNRRYYSGLELNTHPDRARIIAQMKREEAKLHAAK